MITIALVGCATSKRPGRHQAKYLYNSTLFTYSRQYAEANAHYLEMVVDLREGTPFGAVVCTIGLGYGLRHVCSNVSMNEVG